MRRPYIALVADNSAVPCCFSRETCKGDIVVSCVNSLLMIVTRFYNSKLAAFAKRLIPQEWQVRFEKITELGCVDPISLPFEEFKS